MVAYHIHSEQVGCTEHQRPWTWIQGHPYCEVCGRSPEPVRPPTTQEEHKPVYIVKVENTPTRRFTEKEHALVYAQGWSHPPFRFVTVVEERFIYAWSQEYHASNLSVSTSQTKGEVSGSSQEDSRVIKEGGDRKASSHEIAGYSESIIEENRRLFIEEASREKDRGSDRP